MPPKEKPQPGESQVALLHWWIGNGADFGKKVKDIPQSEKEKGLLLALQKAPEKKKDETYIPPIGVEPADAKTVEQLNKIGIVVLPVARNSNYLSANFVSHPMIDTSDLRLLKKLEKQLIWLKLSFTNIGDSSMKTISAFSNLTRLSLDHTTITDAGIAQLKPLSNLQYLNLVATSVSATGILQLKDLKSLRSVFLYQTLVKKEEWPLLQKSFPITKIDSGGYYVETLATDTVEVKPKK